ncbi:helix-turn-helix domain-containing protein [Komagataeibacter oboediens]|uniref:helix-turn-helix domain-containing protein n=1 Tax=Komagataeibacter oboediens TaxID=65958 RepID=UPI0019085481|nr:helix-turn-helix transcriptional regulator [Komagataeibacter oboediens]GCE81856.1 XRE family transcriptional regulator [Komagataeibacter oboediens]
MENFNSRFSTLALMVIKDIRMERNIPIAAWAEKLGKTPSALVKIENSQSSFSIESLFSAGQAIGVFPSVIISITEKLVSTFNKSGFYFSFVLENDEDDLLRFIKQYYDSSGYANLKLKPDQMVSILNINNPFSAFTSPTIVKYCCNPNFRKWVNDGAIGIPPSDLDLYSNVASALIK